MRKGFSGLTLARLPRWSRVAALAVSSLAGCLIISNLALNLGKTRPFLASLISVSPQSINVDYQRAWFIWPSIVHVRQLRIRGSDANVQWQVEIDTARLTVDLTALLRREFHATQVLAQGVGFRLRQKMDAHAASSDRCGPLPSIPGIEGPPFIEDGPPEPDIPEAQYNLWSIHIENVDAMARQLWVDEFHFEGVAHINGAFFLRPKRWLWVGPARARLTSGSVVIGTEPLLDKMSGTVNCTVPPFDPRPPNGMEFFRFISGAFDLDTRVTSVRAFDYYTRIRGNSTTFDGGNGAGHLDGTLRSGVLSPLHLSLDMSEIRAQKGTWFALGHLGATAKSGPEEHIAWIANWGPFALRQADAKQAALRGSKLCLSANTEPLDLSKPAPDIAIHVELPSAQIPDLRVANLLTSTGSAIRVDGGWASIAADFHASTGTSRAQGAIAVSAEAISAHNGNFHFGGRVQVKAHVARVNLDNGDTDLSGAAIEVRELALRDANAFVSNWWSNIELYESRLRLSQRTQVDVTWTAQLKNATPVLAFSKRVPSVPGWITRFLAGGTVEAAGRLQAGKAWFELSRIRAHTGLLDVEGHLREHGEAKSGVFRLSAAPFSIGIEIKNDETNVVLLGNVVEPLLETPPDHLASAH